MSKQEQVAEGVDNSAEIVVANVGYEEITNEDNDIQLDIQSAEVGFRTKSTYKARVKIGLAMTVLNLTKGLIDTKAAPDSIDKDYFRTPAEMSDLAS